MIWVKNFWEKKNLAEKIWLRNISVYQVGLTKGGEYVTPPPQKIVGLKLCWIVVSFAW